MDKIGGYYDRHYERRGPGQSLHAWNRAVLSMLAALPPDDRPGRVLEMGCGEGLLLEQIAGLGYAACGWDLSRVALERAQARGLTVERLDLENVLPNPVFLYGAVVAVEVIEHLFDPVRFLWLVNESLCDAGRFYVSIPCVGYWRWRWRYLRGQSPTGIQSRSHLRFFSPKLLEDLAGFQGLHLESVYSPLGAGVGVDRVMGWFGLRDEWYKMARGLGAFAVMCFRRWGSANYKSLDQVRSWGWLGRT